MLTRRLFALAFCVPALCRPCLAQTPSLADAARLAQQQRLTGQVAARVCTNRDVLQAASPAAPQATDTPAAQAPQATTISAAAAAKAGASDASTPNATPAASAPAKSATQVAVGGSAPATGLVASSRPWGRIAFFANSARIRGDDRGSQGYTEFVTNVAVKSNENAPDALEYGVDTRMAGYSGLERDARVSIYDAWAGVKLMDGALRVRGGQMWITDLGGLGAIAGGFVEYRRPLGGGTLRVAGFGGLEPKSYEGGYVPDVKRYGGYAAFDASALRRYVLGYVMIRDAALTERSVVSSTNYVPIGKRVFVYQALEYDLTGPGGQGNGGLTYFFVNGRASATRRVDLQGSYHRGRSIDARSITTDLVNGRPVPARSLEGMLFESAGGRVTVEVLRGVRAWAGYGRDKNNRDSDLTGRVTFGGSASNVARTGLDATASLSRIDRGAAGSYDSWYASVGRTVGRRLYLTGDYTSSLSVLRFTGNDGFLVETRPETRRISLAGIYNLGRSWSFMGTVERTDEQTVNELRVLTGLTYRLP